MTAQPPDPDPAGGLTPGTTPPAAPQTSGVAEQRPPKQTTPGADLTVIAVCILVVAFIAVAVLLVTKIVGLGG